MSFITRCPSCGTSFRVVADQLKIADGWVRCGHCQQVFDATLDLQPAFAPAPAPAVPREPVAPQEPPPAPPPPEESAPPEQPSLAPSLADWPTPLPPAAEAPLSPPAPDAEPVFVEAAPQADAGEPPPESPEEPVGRDEPSFVRQARRRAFWRRPGVRVLLAVCALGLIAALVAQAAWHWRDTWAARYPQTRPWLTAFCERLGCTLTPPRRPRDVVIEGSVLLRRAPDRYSFHLVVRNDADIEVAAPALELTLTDLQDQVLARRVWQPDAWPQPTAVLAPGGEWPLQFELFFDHPQAARMTGYRATLFYP